MTGQDDWLSHKQLQIIKGIGATPGDTYSAENAPQVVNLMGGIISLEDWSPNIPAIKGGGVWASSPISDGRQLLAAPVGNVVEKMSIRITDTSYLGIMTQMTALNQMVQDCRDFWQSDYQIDPVYLMWYASYGAGPQYALISNIDLAPEYEQSPSPSIRVSISIEREPAWRGIPPGANPRIWTYYVDPSKPQFNVNAASLVGLVPGVSKDLITISVRNKHEWVAAAAGLQVTPLTKNYIDITAAQVPGDAPALVSLAIAHGSIPISTVIIAKTSKRYSGVDHLGITRANALNLNAGDGNTATVVTKTAGTSVTGIVSNGGASFYYGERNATGIDANFVTAVGWGGPTGANGIRLDRQFFRGTFAVFARATNNSAAPTLADMRMRVFIEEFEDNATFQYISSITLPEVQVPLTVVDPGQVLSYMGTVTLPLSNRAVVSPLGYGVQLQEALSNLRVSLQLKYDVATANRIFRVLDLIFVPVDEGMAQLVGTTNTTAASSVGIVDNTGYLSRGEIKQSAFLYNANAITGGSSQEIRGQHIMLKPGVNQRLYFLTTGQYAAGIQSYQDQPLTIGLNIVPRWFGIRDV